MFSTALKDLAVEQQIFVMTSTQVNSKADDNKDIRNESSLAGSRSIINKADCGLIMARPTREELSILDEVNKRFGTPNIVTDVYKIRAGKWNQVRIWSDVNLGSMRKKDLYVTDSKLQALEDIEFHTFEEKDWEDEEQIQLLDFVKGLNNEL